MDFLKKMITLEAERHLMIGILEGHDILLSRLLDVYPALAAIHTLGEAHEKIIHHPAGDRLGNGLFEYDDQLFFGVLHIIRRSVPYNVPVKTGL